MFDLGKFAGGALAEKFNIALKEVLENIADPNTPFKSKRKLIIELTFLPDEDRELTMVDISTKTRLVQPNSVGTRLLIDKDGNGGIIASEYNSQLKGQQHLFVDEETGEIVEPSKKMDLGGIKLVK